MKFVLSLIVGILGFIIGEGISRAIRKDTSSHGDGNEFIITWVLKIGCAFLLIMLVQKGC